MSKKSKILLCVIGIFLVTSILIGISYAYYIFNVSQSGSNVVRSDCFEITYSDGNAINLTNTIPLSDKEARELDPYTFTIKNICNQAVDYSVDIETLNTSTMDLDAIATKLDGRKKQILGQLDDNENIVNDNATSSKTIYSNILKAGEEKTHNLRLWVDIDATMEQSASKEYESKVVVSGVLHPNYSEATLISGPQLNKTFKQLAGTEPTQEEIDSFNEWINSEDFDPSLVSIDYNVYNDLNNQNVHHIIVTNQYPADGITTSVISSSNSNEEVLAWFDTDTIYIHATSKILFNEDASLAFRGFENVEDIDLSLFDTSNVTSMFGMFFGMSSLTSLDVSNFDTSNVTNMDAMFFYMPSLTSLDISNFDTSNVTNMENMFFVMRNLTSLDVTNFDTSNVTSMSGMFLDMTNLTSLDVSNFDTSNVTNMSRMFDGMKSLISLDVNNFDTLKVTDMHSMFRGMSGLTSLDINNFNTSNVTDMEEMFYGMSSVSKIYVGYYWSVDNVSVSYEMFVNCSNLVGGSGTAYDSSRTNIKYARVDDPQNGKPGYFTLKTT